MKPTIPLLTVGTIATALAKRAGRVAVQRFHIIERPETDGFEMILYTADRSRWTGWFDSDVRLKSLPELEAVLCEAAPEIFTPDPEESKRKLEEARRLFEAAHQEWQLAHRAYMDAWLNFRAVLLENQRD